MKTVVSLPDQNQNAWQLASIQSAAFGMPVLQFGITLGKNIGPGMALLSICLGNILLWLVSLRILAMTIKNRANAIENLAEYIINGRWIGGIALFLAFLLWYPIQIKSDVAEIGVVLASYFDLANVAFDIRGGIVIGLSIALLAMGGIKLIKWFNVISFPFLMVFLVYAVINNESIPLPKFNWNLEILRTTLPIKLLGAIFATVAITLVTIINLPTFFRHRRSEADAIFALPIFIFFTAVIECLGVFLVNNDTGEIFTKYLNTSLPNAIIIILFLLNMVFCANLVNIYFASAVWEVLIPWFSRAKELALIGMGGTAVFLLIQSPVLMTYGEKLFTMFIAILGIVVLNGYGAKKLIEHRERKWELIVNTIYWIFGCLAVIKIQNIQSEYSTIAFVTGSALSAFLLWCTLFAEEMFWGFKKVVLKK